MGMCAVREAAVLREMEYFLEIACQFLWLHVERAEALDAGGIDEVSPRRSLMRGEEGDFNHLTERGGVHAHIVNVAKFCRAQVGTRHELVDQRRLAHAAVAAEQGYLSHEHGAQPVEAVGCGSRDLQALIAHRLVKADHSLLIASFIVVEQVGLVEDDADGYTVGFGRGQETVDEGCGGLRMTYRDDKQCLVDIGRQDVALLRKVDALTDNIVAAVLNGSYPTPVAYYLHFHSVAYGYRVRATYAF